MANSEALKCAEREFTQEPGYISIHCVLSLSAEIRATAISTLNHK